MVTGSTWVRHIRRLPYRERVFMGTWTAAALICGALLLTQRDGPAATAATAEGVGTTADGQQIVIGQFPADAKFSDVVQVPGTDQVLLVDDDAKGQLFLWTVGDVGARDGSLTPVDLPAGARLEDGEAITADGHFIYVIGSHSLTQAGAPRDNVLLRLRWTGSALEFAGAVTDLQKRLEVAVAPVAAVRGRTPDQGGLNIEGLAWDPERQRLLLGLRGPLLNGGPMVVPFRLTGVGAALEVAWDGPPLPIPGLEGLGIRALQYDPQTQAFLVLTGGVGRDAHGAASANRFALSRWAGTADRAAERVAGFPKSIGATEIKPEGVCRVTLPNGRTFLLIVSDDAPYYWKLTGRT